MNSTETNDILEMRRQLASLKRELENQVIVSDRLMKEAMSNKLSDIQRRAKLLGLLAIVAAPCCFFLLRGIGMSQLICYATAVLLVISYFANLLTHYRLNNRNLLSGNLVMVYQEVARMRKIYKNWHYFSIPILVVWLAWVGYELYTSFAQDNMLLLGAYGGAILGLIIGGTIGLCSHNKTLHSAEEILRQIEELKRQ